MRVFDITQCMHMRVYRYFAAVMALSTPFWLLGGFATDWELLPGVPISGMMFPVPSVVAFAFVARLDGRERYSG